LLACMISLGCLILSVAIGRGAIAGASAGWRYVTLTAQILCCIYVVFHLYGGPVLGRLMPALLILFIVTLLPFNIRQALQFGQVRRLQYEGFVHDLRLGLPVEAVAIRNLNVIYPFYIAQLPDWIQLLRNYRIGPFQEMQFPLNRITGPFSEQEVLLSTLSKNPESHTFISFSFPQPRLVQGIRMTFVRSYTDRSSDRMGLSWGDAATRRGRVVDVWTPSSSKEQTHIFWIYDTIDRIRIDGNAAYFKFVKLSVLSLSSR